MASDFYSEDGRYEFQLTSIMLADNFPAFFRYFYTHACIVTTLHLSTFSPVRHLSNFGRYMVCDTDTAVTYTATIIISENTRNAMKIIMLKFY